MVCLPHPTRPHSPARRPTQQHHTSATAGEDYDPLPSPPKHKTADWGFPRGGRRLPTLAPPPHSNPQAGRTEAGHSREAAIAAPRATSAPTTGLAEDKTGGDATQVRLHG